MSQAELAPSCSGLGSGRAADNCVLVICGAAGDLTRRELIPSLFELFQDKLLPEACAIIGFSRADWDDDTFRKQMRAAHEEFAGPVDAAQWDRFAACLGFVPGDFTAPADGPYAALAQRIATEQQRRSIPDNVLFHLATPPVVYEEIVGKLAACGLAKSDGGWRRVVIEKPFGADAASAAHLDQVVRAVFPGALTMLLVKGNTESRIWESFAAQPCTVEEFDVKPTRTLPAHNAMMQESNVDLFAASVQAFLARTRSS